MAQGFDRLLLGGALAMTGLLHRRLDQVDRRILDVERADAAPAPAAAPAPVAVAEPVRAPADPATAGMPLPTGYGLQVSGPEGEDIVLPVCLPPGFDLASLELVASFMPREARAPARPRPVAVPDPPPSEAAPAAAEPPVERLGAGLQLVYGDAGYRATVDLGPLRDAVREHVRDLDRFESAL